MHRLRSVSSAWGVLGIAAGGHLFSSAAPRLTASEGAPTTANSASSSTIVTATTTADTTSAAAASSSSAKPSSHETEVLVIGGGIIGMSTAWFLALRGVRVTVVERGFVGNEATGLSAGTIWSGGWGRRGLPGAPSGSNTTQFEALCVGSMALYRYLQDVRGHAIDLVQKGALEYVLHAEEMGAAKAGVEEARGRGIDIEFLGSGAAVAAVEPHVSTEVVLGAIHTPQVRVERSTVCSLLALLALCAVESDSLSSHQCVMPDS